MRDSKRLRIGFRQGPFPLQPWVTGSRASIARSSPNPARWSMSVMSGPACAPFWRRCPLEVGASKTAARDPSSPGGAAGCPFVSVGLLHWSIAPSPW